MELTSRQRQHRHLQLVQFLVFYFRVLTQSRSELRVHIIEFHIPFAVRRAVYHQLYRPVAQQPYANIHHEQIILHQSRHLLHARFLHHELQFLRCLSRSHEHPVVLHQLRVLPQAVAHHIRLRYLLQLFLRPYIHVAARNQRVQPLRSLLHYLLIQRQLQVQQTLSQFLSSCPAEHRYRRQNLA